MSGEPKKVLVVDDDESAIAFVRAALEPDRYEVVGVSDGLAGLSRAREEPPDLIVLDIYMPRQVGFYTLRDLKADPKTKHIPVIMLTAVGKRLGVAYSTQELYGFLGAEPDVHLEKPVDPVFLRRVAAEVLAAEPAGQGSAAKEGGNNGNAK